MSIRYLLFRIAHELSGLRYFGICIGIVLVCLCAGRSYATDTIDCAAEELGLMIHVGSEGFSDLQVFMSQDETYDYDREDFGVFEFKWATGRAPFDKNRMNLIRNNASENKPAIHLEVKGAAGKLIFKGRQYQVECDWSS
jgi:hypothetical protein